MTNHCLESQVTGRRNWRLVTTVVSLAFAVSAMWLGFQTRAKAAPPARHGLLGLYYATDLPTEKDFLLPEPVRNPDATRVDAQIAFGQGQGFKIESSSSTDVLMGQWARFGPLQGAEHRFGWLKAVVWRGYIHFPKAGTYYFATVSHGSSAVYLNDARVTLNGPGSYYGAMVSSDAFSYDQADIADFIEHVRGTPFYKRVEDSYVVPVTVESARDLPIEVRYGGASAGVIGIDLFWVTPDSPKDPSGKPLAKLVPADALYAEAPRPVEQPVVRSANSTLALDLYCAAVKETQPLTITFRLADSKGQPIAGKRVLFNTTADDKYGFDQLTQPENPTDRNGITTAKLRSDPTARAHASSIYAVDATDFVQIGQVGHVRFPEVNEGFFASPCTSGFDPNLITVEPRPMVVGRPLTLRVKLENRQKSDVELNANFQATDWNIGANTWKDIGHVNRIRLKPGENKDVSITWTPSAEQTHQCFRVNLTGQIKIASLDRITKSPPVAVALPLSELANTAILQTAGGYTSLTNPGSGQFNAGSVGPPPPCEGRPTVEFGQTVEHPLHVDYLSRPCTPSQAWKKAASQAASRYRQHWQNHCSDASDDISYGGPYTAVGGKLSYFLHHCYQLDHLIKNADQMAKDPPDPGYRAIAVAASDSSADYLDAWRRSWERYQAARVAGDQNWMNKHASAIHLYVGNLIAALRRDADAVEKQAAELTEKDDLSAAELKSREVQVKDWLRRGAPLNDQQRQALAQAGVAEQDFHRITASLAEVADKIILRPHRALFQEEAAELRDTAQSLTTLDTSASAPELAGGVNQPLVQTFNLANPHDRTEDVRLLIEPLAIPSAWQLSIVNAEQLGATQQGSAGGTQTAPQSEFPIREVHAGQEYIVSLPPGKQIKIASVVVPVGELGANTTARWAVEGRIGGEVIGTMVHEMNVPYIIADLKLPAVGSAEQMEDVAAGLATPPRSLLSVPFLIAIFAGVAVLVILFVVLSRRKGRTRNA
jgi:hypothetical protein